jgi:hypothetical protein
MFQFHSRGELGPGISPAEGSAGPIRDPTTSASTKRKIRVRLGAGISLPKYLSLLTASPHLKWATPEPKRNGLMLKVVILYGFDNDLK